MHNKWRLSFNSSLGELVAYKAYNIEVDFLHWQVNIRIITFLEGKRRKEMLDKDEIIKFVK